MFASIHADILGVIANHLQDIRPCVQVCREWCTYFSAHPDRLFWDGRNLKYCTPKLYSVAVIRFIGDAIISGNIGLCKYLLQFPDEYALNSDHVIQAVHGGIDMLSFILDNIPRAESSMSYALADAMELDDLECFKLLMDFGALIPAHFNDVSVCVGAYIIDHYPERVWRVLKICIDEYESFEALFPPAVAAGAVSQWCLDRLLVRAMRDDVDQRAFDMLIAAGAVHKKLWKSLGLTCSD
jgi:hypothetical protein